MWLVEFFGLNTEFSFSEIGCHTKDKEPNLLCYLPTSGGRILGFIKVWIQPYVNLLCPFPTMVTITRPTSRI